MEERSMFQPDLDEILSIVEIAKRARELVDGDEPLIDTDEINPVSIAIEEIDQGLIVKSSNA